LRCQEIFKKKIGVFNFRNFSYIRNFTTLTVSAIDFELAAEIPFENAANLHMAKMTAAGYITDRDDEIIPENGLEISIFSGSNLESQFEDEKPSCFCTYSFYTYDPCTTSIISASTDPKFNYTQTHRVEAEFKIEI